MSLALLIAGTLVYCLGCDRVGKALPAPSSLPFSLLSLNLSMSPAHPAINADIDLDKQASQELIITGSFNQLLPIQLLLNLCKALVLTRREGAGLQ